MKRHFQHWRLWDQQTGHEQARGGLTMLVEPLANGSLRVHVAVCSWRDNYCKRVGRAVVEGRARSELGSLAYVITTPPTDERELRRKFTNIAYSASRRLREVTGHAIHRPYRNRQLKKARARIEGERVARQALPVFDPSLMS